MSNEKCETTEVADSTDGLICKEKRFKDDEKPGSDRDSWDNKAQYLLAVIGFAVGLGNVWRFPYLAQKNGGGAFLIPYAITLAIEGIPIFYLELALGQRLRKGAIGAWNEVSPYLGGIGIASAMVSFWVSLYYNTIIAWCLFYLARSFSASLPWADCPSEVVGNKTVVVKECELSSPTTYFWYRETLDIAPSVDAGGDINWWVVLCLIAAWAIVFLCMVKGIASSGKVVYFSATFPYLVLIIFFFRGVTLDGFHHGLVHLFVPDFSRLLDPQVWLDAATQIFYSLGLAFGGLIAFASYMPVNNNCYRDAITVSLVNCGTSVFAGIVVFSILGFKATRSYEACLQSNYHMHNDSVVTAYSSDPSNYTFYSTMPETINQTTETPQFLECNLQKELEKSASGTGLVFIAFTEAINQFPVAPLWSALFFLMLLTLGIDSMFGMLEGVVTSIIDMKLINGLRKEYVSGGLCFISLLMALGFATQAGPYVFMVFDQYSGTIPLLIIALCQVLAISYLYGLKRFGDDIEQMTGSRPGAFLLTLWKYVSPLAIVIVLVASIASQAQGATYQAWSAEIGDNVTLEWPGWCKFLAAFLILTSVLWIPGVAVVKYWNLIPWQKEKPAYIAEQDLRTPSGSNTELSSSNWQTKLFYWMPKLVILNEVNKDSNSLTDEVDKDSISLTDEVDKDSNSVTDEVDKDSNSLTDEVDKDAKSLTNEVDKDSISLTDESQA